jgi:hypothetical protein
MEPIEVDVEYVNPAFALRRSTWAGGRRGERPLSDAASASDREEGTACNRHAEERQENRQW